MEPKTWVHIGIGAAIALGGGCGGKSSAGAAAPAAEPVTIESTTSASQTELAAAFPKGKFEVRCVSPESAQPEERRWFAVSDDEIDRYDDDDPDTVRASIPLGQYQYEVGYPADDYVSGILLLDGMMYMTKRRGQDFEVWQVCTVDGDLAHAAKRSKAAHAAELKAYADRRDEVFMADRRAKEAAREQERNELLEQLESIASIAMEAGASGPDAPLSLVVIATLEDGTTIRIGQGNPIFDKAFSVGVTRGKTAMLVAVAHRNRRDVRDEREIAYSFDVARTFECFGEAGKSGTDFDDANGMYYHGRRGGDGPGITVEITTDGKTTDDGQQLLRYRLTCGDKREVFVTSASAPVHVGTYGGKGGHGVAFANGNAGNGGNGGDGGDIEVTVDPSVRRYKLVPQTVGGKGGAPSDAKGQSNVNAYGKRGDDGAAGRVSETRAPVEID